MKNLLKTLLLFFVSIILFQCDTEETQLPEDILIRFGSECGWCAGQEYITVSSLKISYERNIPCGEGMGTKTKDRKISADEWNEIVSSFDIEHFNSLEYNECNICVDGCDEIIQITQNEITHEIRYSPSFEIEGIENLQELLSGLLQEMKDAD